MAKRAMKFKLQIKMGNDAMRCRRDVAAALQRVASRIREGDASGKVMDENGNSVGDFEFTGDPE